MCHIIWVKTVKINSILKNSLCCRTLSSVHGYDMHGCQQENCKFLAAGSGVVLSLVFSVHILNMDSLRNFLSTTEVLAVNYVRNTDGEGSLYQNCENLYPLNQWFWCYGGTLFVI